MTTLAQALPRYDSLEQEVFLNLWRTYDRLKALEDELFGGMALSAQQYNVLRLLKAARPEGLATLALAGRLISRAPDITRMLDKLEKRGLVERDRTADDRRTVRVRITEAGLHLVKELAGPLREVHRRQLGHLDEKTLRKLNRLLEQVWEAHQ
jgi:DNA-binding MarR family transcriptional regulator